MPTSGAASRRCTAPIGEPLAVLAGDSLIVLAFEVLARAAGDQTAAARCG